MSTINDGGHGGKDPGASANGIVEKVYTLEAELYVHNRLLDHGVASSVTRTSDTTLEETHRVNKVSNYKYCLSHHFNAGGGAGAEFIHSKHSDGAFEKMLVEEFKNAGYPLRPKPIFTRLLQNGLDYYYMHRRTGSCQTTIIEYDFVDGPNAENLKDKAYREGMYECVVRATCRREGVAYKPKSIPTPVTPKDDIAGHWAEKSIRKAKDKRIIKGHTDTNFGPDEPVTRGQMAVILDRLGLLD